jgi:ketosteroid isomerase-like protein
VDPARERVVRQLFGAYGPEEFDEVADLITEDFKLDASRRTFDPAVAEGRDGMRGFARSLLDTWSNQERTLERLEEVGDCIVVALLVEGTGRTSGVKAAARGGWVVRFRGEQVAAMTLYQSFDEALASVG